MQQVDMNLGYAILLATLVLQATSCGTPGQKQADITRPPDATAEQVRVMIDGDVKNVGEFLISSDFSLDSILKAVGGFGGISVFGARPKSFALARQIDGRAQKLTFRFTDMEKFKADGFRFQTGDRIVIHRLFF